MDKWLIMDEFHVTFVAPGGLSGRESSAIRAALDGVRFRRLIYRAVRRAARRDAALAKVDVRLSR